MGGITTMKKKINLFIAMILSVTMLFGSTVCFAAENDAEVDNTLSVQSNESVRAARSGLRHLLNLKLPTSRRNAVFFCQILPFYLLYGVVFYLGLCYNRV